MICDLFGYVIEMLIRNVDSPVYFAINEHLFISPDGTAYLNGSVIISCLSRKPELDYLCSERSLVCFWSSGIKYLVFWSP